MTVLGKLDCAASDARGAVFVEKLIAYLPLLLAFVMVWELAELGAANLVVQRASAAAGRAAVVVLPDDPLFYEGEALHSFSGARRAEIELAAGMILSAIPRLTSDFVVEVSDPPKGAGSVDVTVSAPYRRGAVAVLCGSDQSLQLTATTSHAYHGAAYAYAAPVGASPIELGGHSQAARGRPTTPGSSRRPGSGGRGASGGSNQACADCPPGDDALLDMDGKVLATEARPSREASVYVSLKWVYKVYNRKESAEKALEEFDKADKVGLGVPSGLRLIQGKQRTNQTKCQSKWVLRMGKAEGRFFQLSKKGHSSDLRLGLLAWADEDPERLRRAARELMAAYCNGVTDPQGFLNPNSRQPLTFIDLHSRKGEGDSQLQEIAKDLNNKLLEGKRVPTECP